MGFAMSPQEMAQYGWKTPIYYDAEIVIVFFETTAETLKNLLPPPLKPPLFPIGAVSLNRFPRTNLGIAYRQSALFLQAEYGGEEGSYVLSMPVTNDLSMILGRETAGFPKKMADVHFARKGKDIWGWTERREFRFMEVKTKITGKWENEDVRAIIAQHFQSPCNTPMYTFKYFTSPDHKGFDYNPRLIKQVMRQNLRLVEYGDAKLVLKSSPHDPWGDIDVVRVFGAVHAVGDIEFLPCSVLAEASAADLAPFTFMKLDSMWTEESTK